MAAKIYIYGLLSILIVLVGVVGVSNAQKGSNGFAENLQVAAECDTSIPPDPEIDEPFYHYYIIPEDSSGDSPIYIDSFNEKSRSVCIENVPISGFYYFIVEAGYSNCSQGQEEYRIQINDSLGPVIPDTVCAETEQGCHYYTPIDHRLQYLNEGRNIVTFHKGGQEPPRPHSVHFKSIKITRLPGIFQEPKFTQGTTNEICWIEVPIADEHEVFCPDCPTGVFAEQSAQLQGAATSTTSCHTFEGLVDGKEYYYYVEAYRWRDDLELRSDIVRSTQDASPPKQVEIKSIYAFNNEYVDISWEGVCDATSGVEKYIIWRCEDDNFATNVIKIIEIPSKIKTACSDTNDGDTISKYEYRNTLPQLPNQTYYYRIDAVDAVTNSQAGIPSSTVVELCHPIIEISPPPYENEDTCYVKGTNVTLIAKIPDGCTGIHIPGYVKFQAARDNVAFFENERDLGKKFFDSNWKPIEDLATHTFELGDCTFVNDHKYYYRVQFKDDQGNHSEWSETLWAIHDCFPPSDISNLKVNTILNADKSDGWMELKWDPALDYGSGVKCYKIYRTINEEDYLISECHNETTYNDNFKDIKINGEVCYWIGSVDNVGNEQNETNFPYCATSLAPPTNVNLIYEKLYQEKKYTTKHFTLLYADISNFNRNDISSLIVDVNGTQTENETEEDIPTTIALPVALPENNEYTVKVKAMLAGNKQSIWSEPDCIVKVSVLPDSSSTPQKELFVEKFCQNYPNPFNSSTLISYSLVKEAKVSIDIYNIHGQKILNLTEEVKEPGSYNVIWRGKDHNGVEVTTGVYFYKLTIKADNEPNIIKTRKMLFFK